MEPKMLGEIQKYLLRSCPAGETDLLLDNYKRCVGSPMDDTTLRSAMKLFNEEHLMIARAGNYRFLISPASCQGEYYLDQVAGKKVKVDHVKHEVISQEDHPVQLPDLATQLDGQARDYAKTHFKSGEHCHQVVYQPDGTYLLYFSAKNYNLKNYFGGEWNSTWTLKDKSLKGEVSIKCHYYEHYNEDSNIHFSCQKSVSASLSSVSAEQVLSAISNKEFDLQVGFQQYYCEHLEQQFRRLRRVIPCKYE